MTTNELRQKYLEFFKEKGHNIIPSASLIPENDPSVLFTTAGMHPLVPFLMGEKHPAGSRLVNFQKCIRTGDIDEVGDNHHLTFFEMLGNWSLGDPAAPDGISGAGYGRKEAIEWSWEFLTDKKWLGLEPNKLAVSVFAGDHDCPFDQESYNLWQKIGLPAARIAKLDKTENWWPAGGESIVPQGPDTEMFYWTGQEPAPKEFKPNDQRWFEIWNDVFMEFERTAAGQYKPLKQKNVDTGMGLERTTAVLQGKSSVYEIETFKPLMDLIKSLAKNYEGKSTRIIVDHLRASIFIMADDLGIVPSNVRQGYVVRKLVRRAIRHAKKIEIDIKQSTEPFVNIIVEQFKEIYPEVATNKKRVIDELNREKDAFERTLEKGLKEFNRLAVNKKISGEQVFNLYATYGFPLELTKELAAENSIEIDEQGFTNEFQKHQELSRTASSGQFKGGLVSHSEEVIKYHTATHLLHQALREVLGSHVEQRGSNITEKRLRYDFSHPEKMTDKEKIKVEKIVNQKIIEDLPVTFDEMTVEQAKAAGAVGLFTEKYGEKVKVYSIGGSSTGLRAESHQDEGSEPPFSREICGGPHVEKTGVLGRFIIIKEEASSQGVRRIKAILK